MTDIDALKGDLDQWAWDASKDDFVRGTLEIPPEIAAEIPELTGSAGMDRDQFDRIVGAERFAAGLAKITVWFARMQGVQSIALDKDDPAYREASEVVYRRVMDGPGRHLLPYISNRDFIDLCIISTFAVPYFDGIRREIAAAKKEARSRAAMARQEAAKQEAPTSEGADNGQ